MKKLESIDNNSEIERQLVVESVLDKKGDPIVGLHFIEKNQISKMIVVDGEDFDLNDKDGIWLDKRFADANSLCVGDNISLNFNNLSITKEIKGLVYSPEYVYNPSPDGSTPDFKKDGFAYLSYKSFPSYYDSVDDVPFNTALVKTNMSLKTYENDLDKELDGNYTEFLNSNDHISVNKFQSEIEQHQMIGDVFPIVFDLVAILTLITTMARIVSNQRIEIGILKSLGFKNNTIIKHYLSYGFWISLVASILGLILGPITLPHLFYPPMQTFYSLPQWNPSYDISFLYLAILMVIMSVVVSYLSVKVIAREKPVVSLSPKVSKSFKESFIEKSKFWNKLSFNFQWNFRDVNRNKVRGIMAIVGVIGCTALLISAFGMYDAMDDVKGWLYNDIDHYESKLTLDSGLSSSQINHIVDEVDGEEIMESSIDIKYANNKESAYLLVTEDDSLISITNADREVISIPSKGVAITEKIADRLGAKIGDKIKWHIFGQDKWVESEITEIYAHPSSQGIRLSKNELEDLGLNFTPTSIITKEKVENDYKGVKSISTKTDSIKSWDDLTESMMIMVYVLIFFAVVLGFVVLYNLGLLSFT
ncbi:MAG: ABC transporter permease [Methanobrevibacter sp.]|nr:ABC transporter permease [Methanobrevibacter sp.]